MAYHACWMGVPGKNQDLTGQYLDAHYGVINTRYWREMKAAGDGTCLDVGCSVGRYTFESAQSGFAVGMDVNFEQLRLAAEFQRTGNITYTRRRRALGDELKKSAFKPSGKALFILADIHNPPFKMESFDFISALNVIDSVKYPLTALGQIDALLKPKGTLLLSSPYSWNADVSVEFLETEEIEPHEFMRQLLSGRQVPECGFNYRLPGRQVRYPMAAAPAGQPGISLHGDLLLAEKLQSSINLQLQPVGLVH